MKWIIRIYSFVLLGYTGYRTYDFMAAQMGTGSEATTSIVALLFLFATEAGVLLWHEVSIKHCTTETQNFVAVALTWLDLAGSLGAGVADMVLRQTFVSGFIVPPLLATVLIYGLPLAVAFNVAGVLMYLSNDAENLIQRNKNQLRFEITKQALRELKDQRGAIAEDKKRQIYQRLRADVTGQIDQEYRAYQETPGPNHPNVIGENGNAKKVAERTH